MASNPNEVTLDLSPFFKVYKDGTFERIFPTLIVPSSPEDQTTGVSSKDITISKHISARIYLPKLLTPSHKKLPILIYYHGGAFCVESAFSENVHHYINTLASEANVLVVSVEYRLAPENLLPAAYEDSWTALQWVASHCCNDGEKKKVEKESWLVDHGDFDKLFIGGDSAGGNIVHNIGTDEILPGGGVKILGAIVAFPYFWGSKPIGSMSVEANMQSPYSKLWEFVYPSAPGGIDNPMINPLFDNGVSLAKMGCSKLFVCSAEKDGLRERALEYVEAVKRCGWKGEVELVDVEGENHCFQVLDPYSAPEKKKYLINCIVLFIKG